MEVVDGAGAADAVAFSRDIVLDGRRRFDLRVTVAWVDGFGLSLWAYYGADGMEIPRRVIVRMLRANFEYAFVKFALTDDDRPMLMTELPAHGADRDGLAQALVRLTIVADRLVDETAPAIADRGNLPDWDGRATRNEALLAAYRADVEATMPAWEPPTPRPKRRGIIERLMRSER